MSLFSSTATSTSSIPQQVAANYNTAVTNAGAAASQPWQQYSADPNAFVAGLNTTQQAGIANTNASAGQAQPYFNAAQSALGAGVNQAMPFVYGGGQDVNAQQIGGQQIGQFMSPYLGSVYSSMLAGQGQQNAQQQSNLKSGAIGAGAFGGDRAGIGQANLAYQQNLANAQTNANMLNTGYGQALGAAQQQQGVNLGAQQANRAAQAATGQSLYGMGMGTSQQLGALGTGAQTAGLQGAAAQMGAGAAQQKTSQDALTAMYNQFLQSQAYPFQTSQFYTNAVGSLGPLFGGTTTTQTPGLFAARGGSIRGAYAGGGLIPSSMGGGVGYEHAGEGYADGGMPGGWSDYFQNSLGAAGFNPQTTYTPAPNQGGYTQAPGQSAYTQTPMPTYSHAPAGLGAATADYGNIFGGLAHHAAAPSAQQQYSDSQLPNIAGLRSPLVHAPEVKKDDAANPVAAPSGLAGMPYAGSGESGVGGAGQNMGANAPHGGSGSFSGDVKGMVNALGDYFSGGMGYGERGANISAAELASLEKEANTNIETGKAGTGPAGGPQGGVNLAGAARGGRIHRAYGGLNLSTADLANMQAMRNENLGLFPGAPQGYKPLVDNRMQPGLGHPGISQPGHISQVRFPRPAAPSSSNTVGGLINDFSGAQDFYNNVSGDNPDYLKLATIASSALGLATGGTANRGHYSTAGGVYSSEGRESAIPGYSPELGIPDVLTPPQQHASNAPASNGGGGGGGLGDVLKIAGAVLPFLLKRGGAVGDRHEYAGGGLAGDRHGYADGGGGSGLMPNDGSDQFPMPGDDPMYHYAADQTQKERASASILDFIKKNLGPKYDTASGYASTGDYATTGKPSDPVITPPRPVSTSPTELVPSDDTVYPATPMTPRAASEGAGLLPPEIPTVAAPVKPTPAVAEPTTPARVEPTAVATTPPKETYQQMPVGLQPPYAAGPYQQEQSKPLSWFQRNQDLIGAISGGALGMGRGKNALGALLGAVGGAGQGYIAGQKGMEGLAAQEATTQAEPMRVGIQQQQVQNEQMRLTAELLSKGASRLTPHISPTTGEIDGWNDVLQPNKILTLAEGQQIRDQIANAANAPTSVRAAFNAGMPPAPGSATQLGAPSDPLTVRANNPGAIKDGAWAKNQPGYVGNEGAFAKFKDAASGQAAMEGLITQNYFGVGNNTVEGIVRRWASEITNPNDPRYADDKAKVDAYVKRVSGSLGVNPTQPLNGQDPNVIKSLTGAMAAVESGQSVPNTQPGQKAPVPSVAPVPSFIYSEDPHQSTIDNLTAQLDRVASDQTNATSEGMKNSLATRAATLTQNLNHQLALQAAWRGSQGGAYIKQAENINNQTQENSVLLQQAQALRDAFEKGSGTTGELGPKMHQIGSALKNLGVSDQTLNLFNMDPTQTDEIRKLSATLQTDISRINPDMGRQYAQTVNQFGQATPGVNMQKDAALFALNNIIIPQMKHNIGRQDAFNSATRGDYFGALKAVREYDLKNPFYISTGTSGGISGITPEQAQAELDRRRRGTP